MKSAFERWKDGTPLSALCRELGCIRRVLFVAFRPLAGGRDALRALRQAGAGGKAFGGATGGGRTREQRAMDDSKVPVIRKGITKTNGWSWYPVFDPCIVSVKDGDRNGDGKKFAWRKLRYMVYVSPKEHEYVLAKGAEKADLLVQLPERTPRLDLYGKKADGEWYYGTVPMVRFRRLERSAQRKRADAEQKELTDGIKRHEKRRKEKKQRKQKLQKMAAAHKR